MYINCTECTQYYIYTRISSVGTKIAFVLLYLYILLQHILAYVGQHQVYMLQERRSAAVRNCIILSCSFWLLFLWIWGYDFVVFGFFPRFICRYPSLPERNMDGLAITVYFFFFFANFRSVCIFMSFLLLILWGYKDILMLPHSAF